MKIKKLATIVSRAKQLYLYDSANGRQWAGTGSALYLLPQNLPKMDTEQLAGIMDIVPKKAAEFFIETGETPATMPDGDSSYDETELLYDLTRGIIFDATDMLPLETPGGGIYYIPFKQLNPVDDAEQLGLYLRTWGGAPVIAVKDGLFLTALIRPAQFSPQFSPWLFSIAHGTKAVADVTEIKKFMEGKE